MDQQSPSDASPAGDGENAPRVKHPGSSAMEGEAPSGPATVPSAASMAATWCFARARQGIVIAWTFLGDVFRYYWGVREALWEYVAGFAPNLMAESTRMREVRLAPYESHVLAEFSSTGWKATVPARCAVCGEPTQNPPGCDVLEIDDASRAFWVPVGTWLTGALLGLVLWNRWYLLLALPAGAILGYLLKNKVAVRLHVARCDAHVARTNIPQVLAWGNTLVLRFGNKLVRKVFLYGEPMGTTVPQPEAPVSGAPPIGPAPPPPPVPETIPLADSPSVEESTIRHDRPPVFEDGSEPTSPLVP